MDDENKKDKKIQELLEAKTTTYSLMDKTHRTLRGTDLYFGVLGCAIFPFYEIKGSCNWPPGPTNL